METIRPLAIGLPLKMLDLRLVLRNEHVISQRWVVLLEALKLLAPIECFGRLRKNLDDGFRIEDNVLVGIMKFAFSADDQDIGIGEEPFLAPPTFRNRAAADFRVLGAHLAGFAFELVAEGD